MLTRSRIRFFNRTALAALALLVLAMPTVTSADENKRVTIINSTSIDLREFYATNVKAESWGRDHLGQYLIQPGDSMEVHLDDGTGQCQFDFKAIFEGGEELEQRGVDICEIGTWTYRD